MALALPRKAGSLFSAVLRELDSRVCVRMKLDPYPSVCAKKKKIICKWVKDLNIAPETLTERSRETISRYKHRQGSPARIPIAEGAKPTMRPHEAKQAFVKQQNQLTEKLLAGYR